MRQMVVDIMHPGPFSGCPVPGIPALEVALLSNTTDQLLLDKGAGPFGQLYPIEDFFLPILAGINRYRHVINVLIT